MQGKRLSDVQWDLRSPGWAEWECYAPGTYVRVLGAPAVLHCGSGDCWYLVDPMGRACRLSVVHNVTVHEDETITVTPSLLDSRHSDGWHGFLTRGVWRSV